MKEISVLFLDDDVNVLNAVARMFMDEPYGVAVASNHKDALAILEKEKVKVVLSDQRMPDISGVEFLHIVKDKYPQKIRILFTAYADLTATEQAINISEVFRFINKPWNPEELMATVVIAMKHHDLAMDNIRLFEGMKTTNRELAEANKKLQVLYDVQKEFSSTVSHELRTPLASIKAAIDIVVSGTAGDPTPEQTKFLSRAKDNVDRLTRLINDILDLAYLESGKTKLQKTSEEINKIIERVAQTQETVAKNKGLFLKTELDPNVPALTVDSDKIIQVLNNLIANALKFTETGGVTVFSKVFVQTNQIEVRVSDTGCGIKQEDLGRLFEKFQQLGEAHHRYEGTGLGLAICKEIVSQHGGQIHVETKMGEGSSFYFVLPIEERRRG